MTRPGLPLPHVPFQVMTPEILAALEMGPPTSAMHFLCMECESQTPTSSIHGHLDSVWIHGNTQSLHNT